MSKKKTNSANQCFFSDLSYFEWETFRLLSRGGFPLQFFQITFIYLTLKQTVIINVDKLNLFLNTKVKLFNNVVYFCM